MSTTSYERSMLNRCYTCNTMMEQCLMNYFLMHAPSSSPQLHPTMMSPLLTLTRYGVLVNHVLNHKFFHHVLCVYMHSLLLTKILLVLFWPSELALCIVIDSIKLLYKEFFISLILSSFFCYSSRKSCHCFPSYKSFYSEYRHHIGVVQDVQATIETFLVKNATISTFL
jgi:hypothetical protein